MNNINTLVRFPNRIPNPGDLPILIRQTHKNCAFNHCPYSVSDYQHNYCYYCCVQNSIEYNYHFNRQNR